MSISTKSIENKVIDRRAKVLELKQKHLPLFDKENVDPEKVKFIPKMAYIPKNHKETVIALFPSEIRGGVDLYIEFTSNQWEPEDPQRRLWKWIFNPHYEKEYAIDDSKPNRDPMYLIPIDELIDVKAYHEEQEEIIHIENDMIEEDLVYEELPDADKGDIPMAQMTMRDYCAIKWQKPVSGKQWLNHLIKETFNK